MDKIWTPWRKQYLEQKMDKNCIFCEGPKKKHDRSSYIIKKSKYSFVMLNLYPYNNGHLIIAPYRHVSDLDRLEENELLDLMQLVIQSKKLIGKTLKPDGYNLGINIGKIAGAGFEGHIHIHLVPRWSGDTNFMPIISNTKVISQSLESLFKSLKKRIK